MQTKIEVAIYNAKQRLKGTEREIVILQRVLESQYIVISDLEKIEADKQLL